MSAYDIYDLAKLREPVALSYNAEQVNAERRAAAAEIERLRAALEHIAAFDDLHGSSRLEATGSYSGFDEPGSTQIAREALRHHEQGARE